MKNFDQLMEELVHKFDVENIPNQVKVALLKVMAPGIISDIQEIFENYDEDRADKLEKLLDTTFCMDDKAYAAYDQEFDIKEWLDKAEGPPAMGSMELLQAYSQAIFSEDNLKLLQ